MLVPSELRRDPLQPSAVHVHELRLVADGAGEREANKGNDDTKKTQHHTIRARTKKQTREKKRSKDDEKGGARGSGGAPTRGGTFYTIF